MVEEEEQRRRVRKGGGAAARRARDDGRGREERGVVRFIIAIFVITKSKVHLVAHTCKSRTQEDLATG